MSSYERYVEDVQERHAAIAGGYDDDDSDEGAAARERSQANTRFVYERMSALARMGVPEAPTASADRRCSDHCQRPDLHPRRGHLRSVAGSLDQGSDQER